MFKKGTHNENQESQLIKELKKGSYRAFDALYKLYSGRLYGYCYRHTKSVADAEDIVQEVFVNLWKSRDTIRQEGSLQPLLFIMAKNKLINAYRVRLNHHEIHHLNEVVNEPFVEDAGHRIEYLDLVKQVKNGMSNLPVTQQRIIHLSRFQRLTTKEIAETLLLSEQTVKNQLSLGLKALKEKLPKMGMLLFFSIFKFLPVLFALEIVLI